MVILVLVILLRERLLEFLVIASILCIEKTEGNLSFFLLQNMRD